MRVTRWLMIFAVAVLFGCGSGESDFTAEHSAQLTIPTNQQATLALTSVAGTTTAQVFFPANTFDEEVIAMLGDQLLRTDASWRYFPTVDQAAINDSNAAQMEAAHQNDIYAALVINTPADVQFNENIQVRFYPFSADTLEPGEKYVVYRFDFQDEHAQLLPRWIRWGSDTFAVVEPFGEYAVATLPTAGFRGYIGSLAIFTGHTEEALAASEQQTRILGKVIDANGNGIIADVGLYLTVGGTQYPASLDEPYGRAPIGVPDPRNDNEFIDELNTVVSAADGIFEMIIPDRLIGQLVHLEFGHESAAYNTQVKFDLLDPADDPGDPSAQPILTETENLVIWYGENKVVSRPVPGAA